MINRGRKKIRMKKASGMNMAQVTNEIPDDCVEVYTVAVANLPPKPDKKVLALLKEITTYFGFIGICPCYPHGTLIMFDTENNAKMGRNLIREKTNVGDNICKAYVSREAVEELGK